MEKSVPIPVQIDLRYGAMILAAFLLAAASQIPSLFLINNLGDCGYFIVNQELAGQLGIQHIKVVPWWWFSDILGAWWLNISDSYGLWGAKAGGAIITGLTGALTAHTLFQLYKPNIGTIFILALAGLSLQSEMINYLSAPMFLYSVFCYFFLQLNLNPSKTIYPLLCGISFALLTFSRMPMILALLLLPICYLFCQNKNYLAAYLRLGAIILAIFILYAFCLHWQGLLDNYLFFESPSKDHTFLSLLYTVSFQFIEKIPTLLFSASFAALFYVLLKKDLLSGKAALYFFAALALLGISLVFLYIKVPEAKNFLRTIRPDGFDLYLFLVSMIVACSRMLRTTIAIPERILLILAISFPILKALGSAGGFKWSSMTGFLLCGCAYILLNRLATTHRCKIPLACLGALLIFLIGGRAINGIIASRPSHAVKISKEQIARMEGLYIHSDYAEQVGELIYEMEKYIRPGDRTLACPYIPLVYFASRTLPLGNHSCLFFLDFDSFAKKLDQIASMPAPSLIVKAKLSSPKQQELFFGWTTDPILLDHMHRKLSIFEEKIMKRWSAEQIWSNEHFELFVPRGSKE